jgi:isoleucyl-tRNA synthetase
LSVSYQDMASEAVGQTFGDFPEEEERILEFWRKTNAFHKSYELALEAKRKPFVFYDGPPFATVAALLNTKI